MKNIHSVKKETYSHIQAVMRELDESRAKGVDWISSRLDVGARPAGADRFNSYYRIPWCLAVAGKRDAASAVLTWIVQNALDEQGDLRAGAPREPFSAAMASYPYSQIVIGAWHLERYDVAKKVMNFICANLVDIKTGGAFSERPEVRRTGRADLLGTAQLGLAAMTVGNESLADSCYGWIVELYQLQPDLPKRLFPCRIGSDLLCTAHDGHKQWDVITDFHRPFQQFYNPGIAAAFLGRYSSYKNSPCALQIARSYLHLTVQGAPLQFDYKINSQACKFGWGAAVLLDLVGSDEYLEYVLKMARWYVDSQHHDGHWKPSGFLVPNPEDADILPKTAEHVLHVVTLITALAKYTITAGASNDPKSGSYPVIAS